MLKIPFMSREETSPSGVYVAICLTMEYPGIKFNKFTLPPQEANTANHAFEYYRIYIDPNSVVLACIPIDNYMNLYDTDLNRLSPLYTQRIDLVVFDIKDCVRCGKDHIKILFHKFNSSPIGDDQLPEWNYWTLCPNSGDPILLNIDTEE